MDISGDRTSNAYDQAKAPPILPDLHKNVPEPKEEYPPFQLDVNQIDTYAHRTFAKLIKAQTKAEMPYFAAVVLNPTNSKISEVIDGTSFMRDHFKHGNPVSPNRNHVEKTNIYQIDENETHYLCNLADLAQRRSHFAKYLNACDLSLDPKLRGQERYYMGTVCEKGLQREDGTYIVEKDLKKAIFWYRKAIEDHYFAAHIALAFWYQTGNEVVKQSFDNYRDHLISAYKTVPLDNPQRNVIYNLFKENGLLEFLK
jgi:hypothetical protein